MNAPLKRRSLLKRTLLLLPVASLCASVVALQWQRNETTQLRSSLERRRAEAAALRVVAAENRQLEAELARPPESGSMVAAQAELVRLREQVAGAERAAQLKPAPTQPRPDPLAGQRHPEKEMVRLEHFRNVGNATASAAFQTMIWALRVEDDDALVPLLALTPQSRTRVEALLERLDVAARARFRTPEKVVGLLLSLEFLENEALQIAGETVRGPTDASIRRWKHGRVQPSEKKIPFVRVRDGWQLAVPDEVTVRLPETLAEISLIAPSRQGAPP